jgi:hypothetical protein
MRSEHAPNAVDIEASAISASSRGVNDLASAAVAAPLPREEALPCPPPLIPAP